MDKIKLTDFSHNSAFTLNPKISDKVLLHEIKKVDNEKKEESIQSPEKVKNVVIDSFHLINKKRQGDSSIYSEANAIHLNIHDSSEKIIENQNIKQKTKEIFTNILSELNSSLPFNSIINCRLFLIRNFIGRVLLNLNLKCYQSLAFFESLLKYFPDNIFSTDRFNSISKEYISFMIANKKFAALYLRWLTKIKGKLLKNYKEVLTKYVSLTEWNLYIEFLENILKEALNYNSTINFEVFAPFVISKKIPTHPNISILHHYCKKGDCLNADIINDEFPYVREVILHFKEIFLNKYNDILFYTSFEENVEGEKALINLQISMVNQKIIADPYKLFSTTEDDTDKDDNLYLHRNYSFYYWNFIGNQRKNNDNN